MIRVIGVRFRNVGKVYYFSPQEFDIYTGDHVIVETARGVEYGTVVLAPRDVEEDKVIQPLKDVLRVATPEDDEQEMINRSKEREAFEICLEKIRHHGLEMKLIDAEYTFDNNKVLFYFTADGRIDFRELVKDLASVFKTRIELRQIGVRDETKILGGIGICGRPLCCHTFLSEFAPVSIKMAKEQNLSLNPTKISGTCGRLMCCLKNEQETYEYLNKNLPSIGDQAVTPDGLRGEVQSVNVLRQLVKVLVHVEKDEVELREFKVNDLVITGKGKKDKNKKEFDSVGADYTENLEENIAELELLEEKEMEESKSPDKSGDKPAERRRFDRRNGERRNHNRNFDKGSEGNAGAETEGAAEKGSDKKPYEKKFQDKKFQDRKGHEKKPYDKKFYDKKSPDKDRKYKKFKDRGRDKQNDSNVTSE